jgi:hypothetical protein
MTKRPFLVGIVALGAVCSTPTSPCACEPERTHLVVRGTVHTRGGDPRAGATVYVVAAPAGAPAADPVRSAGDGVATTDAQGEYLVRVRSDFPPAAPANVRVAVVAAPADTVRAEAAGASLRSERQVADTLVLDVVVP